jgi:pimeloyl-ACP methyl ester carboxylesterase
MPAESQLLVIHDLGSSDAGETWRRAFEPVWPGDLFAPDLPGHGGEPLPEGGFYEIADVALFAFRALKAKGVVEPPVLVGVGAAGWAAHVMALGGRASALVLVNGLSTNWVGPVEAIAATSRWVREALEGEPSRLVIPRLESREFALRAAAAVTVPVLAVETPSSPSATALASRADVVRAFADATLVELDDDDPVEVARAVVEWTGARLPGTAVST